MENQDQPTSHLTDTSGIVSKRKSVVASQGAARSARIVSPRVYPMPILSVEVAYKSKRRRWYVRVLLRLLAM